MLYSSQVYPPLDYSCQDPLSSKVTLPASGGQGCFPPQAGVRIEKPGNSTPGSQAAPPHSKVTAAPHVGDPRPEAE